MASERAGRLPLSSMTLAVALVAALLAPAGVRSAEAAPAAADPATNACTPTGANRPVCPAGVGDDTATFVDPTAHLVGARRISLGRLVFVAPFATLRANGAPIAIGSESNVEDNAEVVAAASGGSPEEAAAVAALGLRARDGVVMGERTVLGHLATVRGPARLGVEGGPVAANAGPPNVILNQGAMVDRAVVEQNAAVSAYGYVGPGVRIRSGFVVLPGKAVRTQAEADDPALGKVAPLTEADFEGTALSLAANTGFARDYSRLYRDDPRAVRGIGSSPGGSAFSPERVLPVVGAEPGTCDGTPAQAVGFRGRIIGPVCLEDSLRRLSRVTGERVSLRNDEGGGVPWTVGHLGHVDDQTVFHNVPGAGISVGDGVAFGVRSSLHVGPGRGVTVGDGAVIGADSTVFGSTVGEGARIGSCSLVGFADVADGQVVGDNQIVFGDEVFGTVEWACRR